MVRCMHIWWCAAALALLVLTSPLRGDIYTEGHADVGVAYEDGKLHLHFHAEGAMINGVETYGEFEPSAITIRVPLSVYRANHIGQEGDWASDWRNVPESLGLVQGDKFWNLPETFEGGIPFLGIGAEEVPKGVFQNNRIRLALVDMVAPEDGEFTLWAAGANVRMQTFNGIDESSDYVDVDATVHGHWNWAFSKPGDYYLTLRASGTLVEGGQFLETTDTFHFQVVPEPSAITLVGVGLGTVVCVGAARRRRLRRLARSNS